MRSRSSATIGDPRRQRRVAGRQGGGDWPSLMLGVARHKRQRREPAGTAPLPAPPALNEDGHAVPLGLIADPEHRADPRLRQRVHPGIGRVAL